MLYQILFAGGLVFMKDVGYFWHPFFEVNLRFLFLYAFENINEFTLTKDLFCQARNGRLHDSFARPE